jgi:small subunit ribosomal protein S7
MMMPEEEQIAPVAEPAPEQKEAPKAEAAPTPTAPAEVAAAEAPAAVPAAAPAAPAEEGAEEKAKKAPKKKAAPKKAKEGAEGPEGTEAPVAEGEGAAAEAPLVVGEGAEKPKKAPKKKAKAEDPLAEGDVVIETIDAKTDKRVTYTIRPLFDKYPFTGVVVTNPGLQRYININPVSIPHSSARHANRPFAKINVNIVERLINGMMRTEWATGEKAKMYRVVEDAFDIIAKRTKSNPIQVFVDALCNSAPKEEVTRLRYGGINVPKAVDVSASRRLDIAMRNICRGALSSSHNNKKRLEQCLADEIVLASNREINSYAVAKKEELERIAASAR